MARKRITGRAKLPSVQNRLLLDLEKANRRLRALQKSGRLNQFASRKYISSIMHTEKFKYSRRRTKQLVKLIGKPTESESRLMIKQTEKFLRDSTSTKLGIDAARKAVIDGMKQLTDYDVDDEDIEFIYDVMLGEDYFQFFSDKIGFSEFVAIILETKATRASFDDFIHKIEVYMTVSDENTRRKARQVYNKYVLGS